MFYAATTKNTFYNAFSIAFQNFLSFSCSFLYTFLCLYLFLVFFFFLNISVTISRLLVQLFVVIFTIFFRFCFPILWITTILYLVHVFLIFFCFVYSNLSIFFFYLGFLLRTFRIHRTAGEEGGYLFNSFISLPPVLQTITDN